jgi:hypothetical protein
MLILLGAAVAAAAIAWALWPASPPSPGSTATPTTASAPAAAPRSVAAAPAGPRPLRVPERTDPAKGTLGTPALPEAAAQAAAPVVPRPAPEAAEAEGAPPAQARAVGSAMPRVSYRDLKNSVRRFYGNIPASGRLNGPVYAEDVLPADTLSQLDVPPHSRLTMVDHFQAEDAAGYKSVLDTDERYQSALGFSFVTPDGRQIRDYVSVQP